MTFFNEIGIVRQRLVRPIVLFRESVDMIAFALQLFPFQMDQFFRRVNLIRNASIEFEGESVRLDGLQFAAHLLYESSQLNPCTQFLRILLQQIDSLFQIAFADGQQIRIAIDIVSKPDQKPFVGSCKLGFEFFLPAI